MLAQKKDGVLKVAEHLACNLEFHGGIFT